MRRRSKRCLSICSWKRMQPLPTGSSSIWTPRMSRSMATRKGASATDSDQSGQPARRFKDFSYKSLSSWSCERRVIGKAEWMTPSLAESDDMSMRAKAKAATSAKAAAIDPDRPAGRANPRFVVTSLPVETHAARDLYETLYCARGEMENRIKECQLDLFADRTSAHTMRANQLRLWFASIAYVLISALRRIGLAHTQVARAACGPIRARLSQIGARARTDVRR